MRYKVKFLDLKARYSTLVSYIYPLLELLYHGLLEVRHFEEKVMINLPIRPFGVTALSQLFKDWISSTLHL
jgi:hypothetical protein